MEPASLARILIVDNDESTTDTYGRALRLAGYDVRTALSGEAGLREVDLFHPQAVILDFWMPVVGGLEFLQQLRADPERRLTPVAIITGDYFLDEAIAAQLLELGARVYFKPLWVEDLLALVERLLTACSD